MNSEISHPGYRPMRLNGRDYSAPGLYFVTICASQKRCVLGRVENKRVELTVLGRITRESWIAIPLHFPRVNLHSFVIMPNHVHGIIEIVKAGPAQHAARLQGRQPSASQYLTSGSLSVIVRSFKAEVSRRGREELLYQGRIWQPNYYDRVIRDGREFADASRYILENPQNWERDLENPSATAISSHKARLAQHAARLQGSPWDRPSMTGCDGTD
jgi:putative transposase